MHKTSPYSVAAMTLARYFGVLLPLVLSIVLTAELAKAQTTFTDSIKVHLKQYHNISKGTRCVVSVHTVGTHADPLGTGGAGYTYVGYLNGQPWRSFFSAGVQGWIGIKDDPGNIVSYTTNGSSSDHPGECSYHLIADLAWIPSASMQYAKYSTKGGPVAFFYWEQTRKLSIKFDASESYVATIDGHKPVTSYVWNFGDGGTSSEVAPTHQYDTAGSYRVDLIIFDDKGKSDTCSRTVKVEAALLSARAVVKEERADKSDVFTVTGIIENIGEQKITSVTALPDFAFRLDYDDSLNDATVTMPVLTAIPDVSEPRTKLELNPGDTMQVIRQYVVTKLGTYKRAGMTVAEDAYVRLEAIVPDVVGTDRFGDPVKVKRPCDGQLNGTVSSSGCERNNILIGSVGANIVVNSVEDVADETPGDGKCATGKMIEVDGKMVPECTLRAAIEEVNAAAGPQKITFRIPGSGVQTIKPKGSALPPITERMTLDATSQTGYKSTPLIFVDGAEAGVNATGIRINLNEASEEPTRIEGLAIGNFGWYGMQVVHGSHIYIENNHIGTTPAGTAAAPNKKGGTMLHSGSSNIQVSNNTISGNGAFGLCIGDSGDAQYIFDIFMSGNMLGTNSAGTAPIGNDGPGIIISARVSNLWIGDREQSRNIISGNKGDGILRHSPYLSDWSFNIGYNFIGTDITGKKKIPNTRSGIHFNILHESEADVYIGRSKDAIMASYIQSPTNVISGNLQHGIFIESECGHIECGLRSPTLIGGNFIGTDVTGKKPLGNSGAGVFISNVGGISISSNLISANADGIVTTGNDGIVYNSYEHNLVGSDITRTIGIGNLGDGIRIEVNKDLKDGGIDNVFANMIVGNKGHGLAITGSAFVAAQDNLIGIAVNTNETIVNLGNTKSGIYLGEDSKASDIGFSYKQGGGYQSNFIANNTGGIDVKGGESHSLRGNLIFNNGSQNIPPIDLRVDGATENDRLDDDWGPNDVTNTPIITDAYLDQNSGEIFLRGYMSGLTNTKYTIDLHASLPEMQGFTIPVQAYMGELSTHTSIFLTSLDQHGIYVDSFSRRISAVGYPPPLKEFLMQEPAQFIRANESWSISGVASFLQTNILSPEPTTVTSEFCYPISLKLPPTITAQSNANDLEIQVSDKGQFKEGDQVILCNGCPNEETATIKKFGSIIFKEPLKFAHAVGETVVPFARSMDTMYVNSSVNAAFHNGTAVYLRFVGVNGAGVVNVERFRRAPKDLDNVSDSSALPHRWVVGQDSTLTFNDSTEILFRLSGIPNLVLDTIERTAERLNVYHRPVPGSGSFTQLKTRYEKTSGSIVGSGFTTLGEFVLAKDRPLGVQTGRDTKIPSAFALSVAYPNPFSATTSLTLALPQAGEVAVVVFNSLGQQVAVLHNGRLSAGTHTVQFDARNLASGVYFIQAKSPQGGYTRQVLYMP